MLFLLGKRISFRKLKFLSGCCVKDKDPSGKGGILSGGEFLDLDGINKGSSASHHPPGVQKWKSKSCCHQDCRPVASGPALVSESPHSQLVSYGRAVGKCSKGFESRTQIQYMQFSQGTFLKTYSQMGEF